MSVEEQSSRTHLTPYMLIMFYKKFQCHAKHACSTADVPLQAPHKQAGTHTHKRNPRLCLPQAYCCLPTIPASDASLVAKDAYAAFAMGNFANDRQWKGVKAFRCPVA